MINNNVKISSQTYRLFVKLDFNFVHTTKENSEIWQKKIRRKQKCNKHPVSK